MLAHDDFVGGGRELLSSSAALAAVDRQAHAGNVFGFLRREEQRRLGDIPRRAHMTHRACGCK